MAALIISLQVTTQHYYLENVVLLCHFVELQSLLHSQASHAQPDHGTPMAQIGTNMTCLILWQVNWSNDTRKLLAW